MDQTNIFDFMYDKYTIKKPVRLIEFFAGIGSQAKALERMGVNFEHHKICEWAIPSILAYNEIHQEYLKGYGIDYSASMTKDELIAYLLEKGVSNNYNEPMKFEQIKRLNEDKLRSIYNAIISENNLVNISTTKGADLNIEETDKYDYILSYSFPCQDLSNAGLKKGMEKGSGTRSGLLWEVERILLECKEIGHLPNVLLLENVPDLLGKNNKEHMEKWVLQLEKLGYKNYCQILNAKDYGIPQNRRRCFMVSILGDYTYTMPKAIPLKLRLKDMLEDNVDEKYYLSDKMIRYIKNNNEKWTGNNGQALINKSIASTINTGEGSRRCDASNYVSEYLPDNFDLKVVGKIDEWHQRGNIYDADGISPTLCCTDYKTPKLVQVGELDIKGNDSINFLTNNKSVKETIEGKELENGDFLDFYNKNVIKSGVAGTITTRINASSTSGVVVEDNFIPIPEATKKGYAEAHEGDGVDLESFTRKGRRGVVQKDKSQTLKTQGTVGVVIRDKEKYSDYSLKKIKGNIIKGDIVGTITANAMQSVNHDNCHLYNNGLRIRKLTPCECYRLMGFDDVDKERASKVISDSMIYHTAGDSIVVNVLEALFKQLFF